MPLPMSCRLTILLKALLLSRATCRGFRWRGVRSLAEGLGLLVQGLSPRPGERLEKRDSFRTGHGIHFVVVQGADVVATVPSVLALAHGCASIVPFVSAAPGCCVTSGRSCRGRIGSERSGGPRPGPLGERPGTGGRPLLVHPCRPQIALLLGT